MLVRHMANGLSFEAFGGVISVTRQTLHGWREKYKEFREAFEIGYCKALLHYEQISKGAMFGNIKYKDHEGIERSIKPSEFNTAIFCFNMKNRFNWTDNKNNEKDTAPEPVQITYTIRKKDKE